MGLFDFFKRRKQPNTFSNNASQSDSLVVPHTEVNASIQDKVDSNSSNVVIQHSETKPLNNPTIAFSPELPTRIEDFQDCHFHCLKRLQRCPVNYKFTGQWTSQMDIPAFIPILMKLNLIEYADYKFSLHLLSLNHLKSILRFNGKQASAEKNALINKIINEIPMEAILNSDGYIDHYVLTLAGLSALHSGKSKRHPTLKSGTTGAETLNRKEFIDSLMTLYHSNCRLPLTEAEYYFIDILLRALDRVQLDLPLNYQIRGGMLNFLVGNMQIGRLELYRPPYRIQILTKSQVIWIELNSPDNAIQYIPQWIDYCFTLRKYFE